MTYGRCEAIKRVLSSFRISQQAFSVFNVCFQTTRVAGMQSDYLHNKRSAVYISEREIITFVNARPGMDLRIVETETINKPDQRRISCGRRRRQGLANRGRGGSAHYPTTFSPALAVNRNQNQNQNEKYYWLRLKRVKWKTNLLWREKVVIVAEDGSHGIGIESQRDRERESSRRRWWRTTTQQNRTVIRICDYVVDNHILII